MIELLHLQIQSKFRGFFKSSGWALNILSIFLSSVLVLYCLALGFWFYELINKIFPDEVPSEVFAKGLCLYFLFDLAFRLFLQRFKVEFIQYFQLLPINLTRIINAQLLGSLLNLFSLLPLLLFVPCVFKAVAPTDRIWWLLLILFLILHNHYLVFMIRIYNLKRSWIVPFLMICLLAVAKFFWNPNIDDYLAAFLLSFVSSYWPVGVVFLFTASYFRIIYHKITQDHKFVDQNNMSNRAQVRADGFTKLPGILNDPYLLLDLKLILRNKRPRSMILVSMLFPIIFGIQLQTLGDNPTHQFFYLSFITIILPTTYGQFLFSWESAYYDFVLTRAKAEQIIRSKHLLFILLSILSFILSVPSVLIINPSLVSTLIASAIFHTSFTVFIMLYFGTFNIKKIGLSKSTFMNYEGVSLHQFLLVILLMAIPVIIYNFSFDAEQPLVAPLVIGGLGILGLMFSKWMYAKLSLQLQKRKYIMAEGFRNEE